MRAGTLPLCMYSHFVGFIDLRLDRAFSKKALMSLPNLKSYTL